MKPNKIHPELRDVVAKFPSLPLHNRAVLFLIKAITSLSAKTLKVPGVSISTKRVNGVKIRIYSPTGKSSAVGLLWIHGGGLIIGSAKMNDRECSDYVNKFGMTVVSVDYRLAPRHRYPAAIDDCFTAWNWFQENAASLQVKKERIFIAGQSAGGGLAAALVHRVHDQGGTPALAQLFT